MNLVHTLFQPAWEGPHPTILALHGWGANAMDLLTLAPHLGQGRFLIICPQGPVEVSPGGSFPGYGWFRLEPDQIPNVISKMEDILASLSGLHQFIDDALRQYPIDPQRMVVLGFSQGGLMAYALGLGHPSRFRGLASLSSWLAPGLAERVINPAGAEGLRTLVHHGLKDTLIDISKARDSVNILQTIKVSLTYREYDMGHEITAQSLVDLSRWLEETLR